MTTPHDAEWLEQDKEEEKPCHPTVLPSKPVNAAQGVTVAQAHFMSIPVSEFEDLHDRLRQAEKKTKRLQGELNQRNKEISKMASWIFKQGKHHHRSYAHAKSFSKCEFPICKSANEILKDWEVS